MNRRLIEKLRAIEKRLIEVDQRLARVVLHGKVTEVRQQQGDWQVRLEIGRDPESDAVVKSPWAPVQPASAGALKIKAKPSVGERMTLLSPSGTVGSGSWAIRGPFDDDHPAPQGDEDVVLERGDTRIEIDGDHVKVTVDQAFAEVARERVRGRLGTGRFVATAAYAKIRHSTAYVVVVPDKVIVSHPPVVAPDPDPST
jgi:phage baseplate assembly protein gpV